MIAIQYNLWSVSKYLFQWHLFGVPKGQSLISFVAKFMLIVQQQRQMAAYLTRVRMRVCRTHLMTCSGIRLRDGNAQKWHSIEGTAQRGPPPTQLKNAGSIWRRAGHCYGYQHDENACRRHSQCVGGQTKQTSHSKRVGGLHKTWPSGSISVSNFGGVHVYLGGICSQRS